MWTATKGNKLLVKDRISYHARPKVCLADFKYGKHSTFSAREKNISSLYRQKRVNSLGNNIQNVS